MRADIQIASDMFEIGLALEIDWLSFERLRRPLHGEVHQLEEVGANPVLSNARRGSESRNNDGVLFAMGQNQSEVGYVRLVLKSRGAWQQIHERRAARCACKATEIAQSPDQGRSPARSGSDLPCTRCSGSAPTVKAASSSAIRGNSDVLVGRPTGMMGRALI